jgi:hypothetical protein
MQQNPVCFTRLSGGFDHTCDLAQHINRARRSASGLLLIDVMRAQNSVTRITGAIIPQLRQNPKFFMGYDAEIV